MAFPTLRELAAFVQPAPDPSVAVRSLTDAAQAMARRSEANEQARQFEMNQAGINARHAGDLGFNYANLDETQRHAMQTEQHARNQLAQTQAEKQAAALATFRELAQKGAPPEVLRAAAAEIRRLGGQVEEDMTQPEAPPPKQLGAFGGLNARMGMAPPPAPEAPPPQPTGRFRVGAGGEDLGAVDVPAIRSEQRADFMPGAQAAVAGARPEDRRARVLAATTVGNMPGLLADPVKAGEAMANIADKQLGRESSERNARQMSVRANQRGASMDTSRVDGMAMRKANTVKVARGLPQLEAQYTAADEAIKLMESGNPIAQNDAFLAHLRAQQGSRPTDKDLAFQLKQGGLEARLKNALESMASGKFDPAYADVFMKAARIQKGVLEKRRLEIARSVHNSIMSSPAIRGLAGPEAQLEYAEEQAAMVIGGLSDPTGDGSQPQGGGGSGVSVSAKGDIVPGPAQVVSPTGDDEWGEVEVDE